MPTSRPDDLAVTYSWRQGSLPPPYYYEYTISIRADGAGEIEMLPNYPSDETPVWTETFTLSGSDLDELYAFLVRERFFQTKWAEEDIPPVGGSSQSLLVTAQGVEYWIPSFVEPSQSEAADRILVHVRLLAPSALLGKLEAQREQYMQENEQQ